MNNNIETFLTIEDMRNILHIGRDKARKLIKSDGFPYIKIGNTIRIPKDEFIKWYKMASYSQASF